MNLDVISFLIGFLSSVIALVSAYFTRKVARKSLGQFITLKNSQGDLIEIAAENNSYKNMNSYIQGAIEYEMSVASVLGGLSFKVEEVSVQSINKGYDFLFESNVGMVAVEVKSHSKPLSVNIVKNTLDNIPDHIYCMLYVSKSGFLDSSIKYIENSDKNIVLASGENEALKESVENALKSKNIKSQINKAH